jgi:hypothetical protein
MIPIDKQDAEADWIIYMLLRTSLSSPEKAVHMSDQLPAQDLAACLRKDRISIDALIKVVERLHEIETAGMARPRGNLTWEKEVCAGRL